MKFDKLVRDQIPDIIKRDGKTPITHVVEGKEYQEALIRKLQEEIEEFLEKPCVEEVADILEVLHAICDLRGVDLSNLEAVRKEKAIMRGGFKRGIFFDAVE